MVLETLDCFGIIASESAAASFRISLIIHSETGIQGSRLCWGNRSTARFSSHNPMFSTAFEMAS